MKVEEASKSCERVLSLLVLLWKIYTGPWPHSATSKKVSISPIGQAAKPVQVQSYG
jgi:hypothetical protein